MKTFLGVDGGGSKTAFMMIDDAGRVLGQYTGGPTYHPEIGIDGVRAVLERGFDALSAATGVPCSAVDFAFVGLPAHGEDSRLQPTLDALPAGRVPQGRFRCGNDMICGWAGALACADGINVVAGTGSIVYGEYRGHGARCGGWGELFSDEGSAYWVAREGLRLFSRMSDGREARGALHGLLRAHFGLGADLDLCAAIYGADLVQRSQFSQLSKLVAQAALEGDDLAQDIFRRAALELAAMVTAVRHRLQVPERTTLPVSYSGGLFRQQKVILEPLKTCLARSPLPYAFVAPRLPPSAGAALYAASLGGHPLAATSLATLQAQLGNSVVQ
jgi:N-acetylglucosamine kinase-like BadF-type ATPase